MVRGWLLGDPSRKIIQGVGKKRSFVSRSKVKKSVSPNENDHNKVNTSTTIDSSTRSDASAAVESKSNTADSKPKKLKFGSKMKRNITVIEPFSFTIRLVVRFMMNLSRLFLYTLAAGRAGLKTMGI